MCAEKYECMCTCVSEIDLVSAICCESVASLRCVPGKRLSDVIGRLRPPRRVSLRVEY